MIGTSHDFSDGIIVAANAKTVKDTKEKSGKSAENEKLHNITYAARINQTVYNYLNSFK